MPLFPKKDFSETENIENKDLVCSLIGKNSEKIYPKIITQKIYSQISFLGFLFGPFYFFYRKVYQPFIFISPLLILVNFIPGFKTTYMNVFYLLFYPFYKEDIERKIKKIKQKNPSATMDQLIVVAKSEGGTNILGIPLAALMLMIVFLITAFIKKYI
jgi:hypothetical protein